jgi:hypothetical protein
MLDGCVCGPTIRVRHDKNRTREFNGLSFSAFFLGSPLQAPKTAVAGMVRPCFPLSCPQQRRITASVAPRSVRLGRGVPTRSAGRCRVGSAFPRTTPLLWHKRSFGGTAEPSDIASSRAAAPALRSVWRVVSGRARSRSTRRPATHSGRCPASRAASSQGTVGRAPQPGSASRALKRSAPLGHATARPARRRGSVSRDVPPASRAGTAAALPAAHTPWLRPRGFGRSYRISNQCIPPAPRLAASLPGCAVSESPVWRFDASRGEVIGSRVSLRAVSERLRMPDLVAPGNEVLASAALAQALLRSSPPVLHQFAERGRPSLTH